jgi:hypothetical protein
LELQRDDKLIVMPNTNTKQGSYYREIHQLLAMARSRRRLFISLGVSEIGSIIFFYLLLPASGWSLATFLLSGMMAVILFIGTYLQSLA